MAARKKNEKKGKKPKKPKKKAAKPRKKEAKTIDKKETPILIEDEEVDTKPIPEDEELLFERP
jgi:hypothetical protein